MARRQSAKDTRAPTDAVPHASLPVSSNVEVARALRVKSEDPTGQDDPEGLRDVADALRANWTMLFPEGFHEDKEEHQKALDRLCQTYGQCEFWHPVFGEIWQTDPLWLRNAIIQLTADHNDGLLSQAEHRQKLPQGIRTSLETPTESKVSVSVPRVKRRHDEDEGEDDDSSKRACTLDASNDRPEQECVDRISAWVSKLNEVLDQKSSQHDRELSTRADQILGLQRLVAQKDKEAAALSATIGTQKHALNKADGFERERDNLRNRLQQKAAVVNRLKTELGNATERGDKLQESLTVAENDKLRARRDAETTHKCLEQVRKHRDDAERRLMEFDELLNRPRGWGGGIAGERGGAGGSFQAQRRRG